MNFSEMSKEELIEYINGLDEQNNGKYGLVWDKEKEPEKHVTNHEKILERLKDPETMVDYLQSCTECPIAESCAGRLKNNWTRCRNKLKLWLQS